MLAIGDMRKVKRNSKVAGLAQIQNYADSLLRACAISVMLTCGLVSGAAACVQAPSPKQTEESLRTLINDADHVFIAVVGRILRRRWGPDDEMGPGAHGWLERQKKGMEIPPHAKNTITFSNATANLLVLLKLKESWISDRWEGKSQSFKTQRTVKINLLRPFTVAGTGPCYNFPRTCPWTTKPGDLVLAAVVERRYEPWLATFCMKVEPPPNFKPKELVSRRKTTSADELAWPLITAAHERLRRKLKRELENRTEGLKNDPLKKRQRKLGGG